MTSAPRRSLARTERLVDVLHPPVGARVASQRPVPGAVDDSRVGSGLDALGARAVSH